jgi:hypothetical protein
MYLECNQRDFRSYFADMMIRVKGTDREIKMDYRMREADAKNDELKKITQHTLFMVFLSINL